jgi:PAS domain S-box-containing protein
MHNMPEVEESKKSLRYAIIQTLGITLIVMVGIMLFSNLWMKSTVNTEKQKIESNLIQIMTLARNSIEPDIVLFRNGTFTRDDALMSISIKLRNMTYSDKYGENYIFLVTNEGKILVQPYQPWLENTDQWNMQDDKGVYLIQGLLKASQESDNGSFFTYNYKPPNLQNQEEKLSYVIAIPELDCFIGTGMYMRLYYQDQTETIQQVTLFTLLAALVILLTSLFSLRRIRQTSKKLETEIIKRGEVQLRLLESEKNLRAVFNSMSDAVMIHTESGEIIEVNDRVLEMFGCSRQEIIGNSLESVSVSEEFTSEGMDKILQTINTGESSLFEYRCKRLDNQEVFYVEVSLRKVNWYGRVLILAVVRNIQNRKFIERELSRSQAVNEHAEALGLFGNFFVDFESNQAVWSKGLYSIFQRDEKLPAPDTSGYHAMIHPEDLQRVLEWEKQSHGEEARKINFRIIRGDKEVRDIREITKWIPESKALRRYLIGAIQDVTEQNRKIAEIRQNEEKYRTIVQQMSDGLVLIDETGKILEWNVAHEKITEIPAEKAIGEHVWKLLPNIGVNHFYHNEMELMEKEILTAAKTGQSEFFHTSRELTIKTANGKIRTLMQTVFPIQTPNNLRIGVISHDITEQKASLDKINHELKKLASLRSIDAAILEKITPTKTLELICSIAVDLLNMDGAIILTRMANDETTSAYVSRIDTPEEPLIARILELQSAAQEKFKSQTLSATELELVNQIQQFDPETGKTLFQAILPLIINRNICGYIQVFSRMPLPEDQEWMDYFLTLAGQTSLGIENVTLIANEELAYNELNRAYEATIAGWSKALELRDEETKGHSDRVMSLACRLAKKAGFPREKMTSFRRGVLLHDIGKMGIPDRILLKPGPLTDEEWKIMRLHPGMAYDLLSTIPYLHDSLDVPYSHHERWDGSGYPKGLKGIEIPLSARIFAIVDVWDALISDRPYRNGWQPEKIRQYLIDNKSVQFDPELVDIFIQLMDRTDRGEFDEDDTDCWV